MDSSNIYRFNGKDPFDNWTIKDGCLIGYYPRNSLINLLNKSLIIKDKVIIIPNSVISIENSCFRKSNYMKVYIPSSVKRISVTAFLDTEITLCVTKDSYAEKYAKRKGLRYEIYEETSYQSEGRSN